MGSKELQSGTLRWSVCFISICVFCLCLFSSSGYGNFGYISYSSSNIGDDIQALAAKRLLPEGSIPIDREFISQFHHDGTIKTLVNGWFMHAKGSSWYRTDMPAPEKSWPPSPCIDPLFISLHFTKEFLPTALSDEAVEYLKHHAPIGARDFGTLYALQSKGIPSYFSGCMTLTLENSCQGRDDIIYAVDIDDECLNYLRSNVRSKIKIVHHGLRYLTLLTNEQRLRAAERLLDMYSRAKCVVTTRLHGTLPCLALKTPVLLITCPTDSRLSGLRDLARWCTKEEFLRGEYDFSFDEPTENPTAYLPLREQLIKTVKQWAS